RARACKHSAGAGASRIRYRASSRSTATTRCRSVGRPGAEATVEQDVPLLECPQVLRTPDFADPVDAVGARIHVDVGDRLEAHVVADVDTRRAATGAELRVKQGIGGLDVADDTQLTQAVREEAGVMGDGSAGIEVGQGGAGCPEDAALDADLLVAGVEHATDTVVQNGSVVHLQRVVRAGSVHQDRIVAGGRVVAQNRGLDRQPFAAANVEDRAATLVVVALDKGSFD